MACFSETASSEAEYFLAVGGGIVASDVLGLSLLVWNH